MNLKHGVTSGRRIPRDYRKWSSMLSRCYNPSDNAYERYGDRGIRVCDRWRHSFENFLSDMGPCPPGLTLERKDNDGNYEPGNCKWATPKEQANNRSSNRHLTFNGQTFTIAQWSKEIGIEESTIWRRLSRDWSIEKTLSTKKIYPGVENAKLIAFRGRALSISEWSRILKIHVRTLSYRLGVLKWPVETALTTTVKNVKNLKL